MTVTQNGSAAVSDELQDLYRQLVLEHARQPKNFRRLDDATHSAEGINPLCGDKVHLYLVVDSNERIKRIGFEGSGCAISIASASLMTETLNGLPVAEANEYFNAITQRLGGNTSAALTLSKLRALDGVRQYPSRVKCATLPWHTLHAALHSSPTSATTE